MALFPLFVDVEHKRCLLVGAGKTAARKAEALLRFGMKIDVVAPEIGSAMSALAADGRVRMLARPYESTDMPGAMLAIAATSEPAVNDIVYRDALSLGIPVNVVDVPDRCTFVFPAIVKRGDMVIGITSSGRYPALSKKLRRELELHLSGELGKGLELLAGFRDATRKDLENYANESRKRCLKTTRDRMLDEVLDQWFDSAVMTKEALEVILMEQTDRWRKMTTEEL